MFTSRVEYRLVVREDNADRRLSQYGHQFGLITDEEYRKVEEKYRLIEKEITHLRTTRVAPGTALDEELNKKNSAPLKQSTLLSDLLKRPEVDYAMIAPYDGDLKKYSKNIIEQVEYEIKYEGFIERQARDIARFRHIENIKLSPEINYDEIPSLSKEIRQKLNQLRPMNLGQAHRISGVTPAAISILMIWLKKKSEEKRNVQ